MEEEVKEERTQGACCWLTAAMHNPPDLAKEEEPGRTACSVSHSAMKDWKVSLSSSLML